MKYNNKSLRHELKYIINTHEYLYLVNRIKHRLSKDKNAKENNSYHIRSLYFDDMYENAFIEKEMGVSYRKKYRVRIYNLESKIIKLEKKSKYNNYINKEAETITEEEFYKILNNDYDFLMDKQNQLLNNFYIECKTKLLKPRIIVDYDREAYICSAGNIRITFDKDLRAGINGFDIFSKEIITKKIFQEPVMIMEIKYDSFIPEYVKNLLQIDRHIHVAASKFVMCANHIKNIKN